MGSASGIWYYIVTSPHTGQAPTQNDPCIIYHIIIDYVCCKHRDSQYIIDKKSLLDIHKN